MNKIRRILYKNANLSQRLSPHSWIAYGFDFNWFQWVHGITIMNKIYFANLIYRCSECLNAAADDDRLALSLCVLFFVLLLVLPWCRTFFSLHCAAQYWSVKVHAWSVFIAICWMSEIIARNLLAFCCCCCCCSLMFVIFGVKIYNIYFDLEIETKRTHNCQSYINIK